MDFSKLRKKLQDARDAVDDADSTPFGKIGELLDELATLLDRALDEADLLEAEASWGKEE